MISLERYRKIREKYGDVASWAIWMEAGVAPKSNIGDMDIFDESKNIGILDLLNVNVVMVGLNLSRDVKFKKPFMNFHDANPRGNDFKIRYAFENTMFYGAYMTDIIKNLSMTSSKDVLEHLKKSPRLTEESIESFREEMNFIGAKKPVIFAFGKDTYAILKKSLEESEYSKLVQLTHYSHQIGKENYRSDVHKAIIENLGVAPSNLEFIRSTESELRKHSSMLGNLSIKSNDEVLAVKRLQEATKSFLESINSLVFEK